MKFRCSLCNKLLKTKEGVRSHALSFHKRRSDEVVAVPYTPAPPQKPPKNPDYMTEGEWQAGGRFSYI